MIDHRHASELWVRRLGALLRDETAVTMLEYVLATLAVVLVTIAASRVLANVMVGYLRRIYLVVTLPVL